MTNNLDTLATALYVKTDDLLTHTPDLAPWRPRVGIVPRLSDAELVTLAVMQALLGFTSESRWLRHARAHLGHLFRYLPRQPGYNKRLRAASGLITAVLEVLSRDTSLFTDDAWVVDSTPVECGRSRETTKRSDLAGWAEYGYCASHSRFFWGLRLHLVCTLGGLPIAFAVTGAKADERQTLLDMLATAPTLARDRPGQTLIGDKNYFGAAFETNLAEQGLDLLRPARKGEAERPGARLFKPLRQTIESINQTFKGQLDLERHGGRTHRGVTVRILCEDALRPLAGLLGLAIPPARPSGSDVVHRPMPVDDVVARLVGVLGGEFQDELTTIDHGQPGLDRVRQRPAADAVHRLGGRLGVPVEDEATAGLVAGRGR